jgi:hypothetical protein
MTTRLLRALALATLPGLAAAHEGHGLFGPHWHATDAWGFVAVGLLVAVIWFSRRK